MSYLFEWEIRTIEHTVNCGTDFSLLSLGDTEDRSLNELPASGHVFRAAYFDRDVNQGHVTLVSACYQMVLPFPPHQPPPVLLHPYYPLL